MPVLRAYQDQHGLNHLLNPLLNHSNDPCVRALVADDNETMREMVGELIAKWKTPIDFTPMAPAREGLIDIHILRPDVHFIHLNMPGVDGLALLHTLKTNPAFDGMMAITGLSAQRGGPPANTVLVQKPVSPAWPQGFLIALVTQRQRLFTS
jgi:CheY-like chemotaxis protein